MAVEVVKFKKTIKKASAYVESVIVNMHNQIVHQAETVADKDHKKALEAFAGRLKKAQDCLEVK